LVEQLICNQQVVGSSPTVSFPAFPQELAMANDESKRLFPYNSVVGIIDDLNDTNALVERLRAAGVPEDKMAVLAGEAGVRTIDVEGKRHGLLGRIFRAVDRIGDERDETQLHLDALREGHRVVVVSVTDDQQKDQVSSLFKEHHGHEIHYYSRWTTETIR
jgi:hypothetical protein